MKSNSFVILFLAGLAVGMPTISEDVQRWQATIKDYRLTKTACHTVLTFCRTDADCCPGLGCVTVENDSICTPNG
ncbi:hypothetical protein B0H66DRAFT_555318 [Apodospora peruviana]|uniref:Conotoxin n=1 Tax=Apodospora peruviana TaxID=516989 RepID=A0AAE0ID89_9PEZI|nr:hypothetical protein B0H66DRAFT_555318 [Apodospora peruviana]